VHDVHCESFALLQVSCDVQRSISPHGTHDEPSALKWKPASHASQCEFVAVLQVS
jgi:hypothetical protein